MVRKGEEFEFLVSRIQEGWRRGDDHDRRCSTAHLGAIAHNHRTIVTGQAKSGRIIADAAMIMVLALGSFLLSGERILPEFGFGVAFATFIDALVIRSLVVPAIMHMIGLANWSLPDWLDRILPNLSIRGQRRSGEGPGARPSRP